MLSIKGGEFTKYAGNGDGSGFQSGFQYTGKLSKSEISHYLKMFVRVSMVGLMLEIQSSCITFIQVRRLNLAQR